MRKSFTCSKSTQEKATITNQNTKHAQKSSHQNEHASYTGRECREQAENAHFLVMLVDIAPTSDDNEPKKLNQFMVTFIMAG